MIKTVEMYRVVCDRCGRCIQDESEFFAWAEAEQAVFEAEESDWITTNDGKHYCDDCIEWNEDEDQLVPKPADV